MSENALDKVDGEDNAEVDNAGNQPDDANTAEQDDTATEQPQEVQDPNTEQDETSNEQPPEIQGVTGTEGDEHVAEQPQEVQDENVTEQTQEIKDEQLQEVQVETVSAAELPQEVQDEPATEQPQEVQNETTTEQPQEVQDETVTEQPQEVQDETVTEQPQDVQDENATEQPQEVQDENATEQPKEVQDENATEQPQEVQDVIAAEQEVPATEQPQEAPATEQPLEEPGTEQPQEVDNETITEQEQPATEQPQEIQDVTTTEQEEPATEEPQQVEDKTATEQEEPATKPSHEVQDGSTEQEQLAAKLSREDQDEATTEQKEPVAELSQEVQDKTDTEQDTAGPGITETVEEEGEKPVVEAETLDTSEDEKKEKDQEQTGKDDMPTDETKAEPEESAKEVIDVDKSDLIMNIEDPELKELEEGQTVTSVEIPMTESKDEVKESPSKQSGIRSPPAGAEEETSKPTTADQSVTGGIPVAPRIPSVERSGTSLEGNLSSSALNVVWSFGLNRNVPVLNLTDGVRKVIMYACAHVGVLYDFHNNRQHILQGHGNPITCLCVSEDKRWLVTGDKGSDAMVIVWDTYTGVPIQTLFDSGPDGGVIAIALSADARYLATISAQKVQTLSIWDWTIDGETPICTAILSPKYGVQNHVLFNPADVHYLLSNSESQVIFYHWENKSMQYFTPPLSDEDFNKPVGRYSQSIFQTRAARALTGTSIGNVVVWNNNKTLNKGISPEVQPADKRALKIIRLQDRGINVLTTTDNFIVAGDVEGQVKFFDQRLKLIYCYQDLNLGPISAISFSFNTDFQPMQRENTTYPSDASIAGKEFIVRDFVVGSSIAIFGNVTVAESKVDIIHREHDASVHALSTHPFQPYLVIGSYSGLLKTWDYEKKEVLVSRMLERGNLIRCCTYDPKGAYIAVGFTNGAIRLLDSITLLDEIDEPFHYARDAVTQMVFSHDSMYLAAVDAEYTITVFKKSKGILPYMYLGRYRAHYKPIKDIIFGVQLDSNASRLISLGEDRVMVEYDLEKSETGGIKIASSDRIEQSGVPLCMAWYPAVTKENFIVTATDQFKFKLFNATTKMCRKTLLGPTYGSPVQRLAMVPNMNEKPSRYMAYATEDKVGMTILPLDGNPHNSMALIAHPSGVANMVVSYDGSYLFTAGGADATVHMWEININALEAQAKLGGDDLIPFYGLLDGGHSGELFAELEDYFYYAQIRTQGVNTTSSRHVSIKIKLSEVPFVMRAMGFYPSEQEIEDMLNEVKFSEYVETGQYVDNIDLGDFIKLYVNHRPAFGLSPERITWAFETLGIPDDKGSAAIERGELLDLLQSKGEHMTEYELAEYLTTLLGYNAEGGSSELQEFDAEKAGERIDEGLPFSINSDMFSNEILGFSMYSESPAQSSPAQIL